MASSRASTDKGLQVSVQGAREIRNALKDLGEKELLRELSKDNKRYAETVRTKALEGADQGRQRIVARQMVSLTSRSFVGVRLPALVDVNDKRGPRPVGLGAEFGAHHNRQRLEKNTGGRRTIVREGEDVNRVIKRVEAQTRMGFDTVRKKARTMESYRGFATAVKVVRVVRGWNMFDRWRGNGRYAGYFLYPAVRDSRAEIAKLFDENINRIWGKRR